MKLVLGNVRVEIEVPDPVPTDTLELQRTFTRDLWEPEVKLKAALSVGIGNVRILSPDGQVLRIPWFLLQGITGVCLRNENEAAFTVEQELLPHIIVEEHYAEDK